MKLSIVLFISLILSACMPKAEKEFKIDYEKFVLENGLEVVLHVDKSDPIVAVATIMHVGSGREKPGRTGFAHFFEHMSFNDSENVPRGWNRKIIPEWGGSRNGGTWSDGTIYYEVVPKDAFEKILWIDSDRLGYMIKTVTKAALEREKQVVKNEKRERVDNSPYGYTSEVIKTHLYPADHPYNWTTIGSLPDLQAATLEDVTEFYNEFYGANNATLVIAGDIDIEEAKKSVQKWFGEIRRGPAVNKMTAMPVSLNETKSLYFEDNFAKLPELRMVFPSVEEYHKDSYALEVLGQLLSGSKKSPLYKLIVEEKKLAPNVSSYQSSSELAGEFVFRVRANSGKNLNDVKAAIEEGLKRFETDGFTDNELKRIKAEQETSLYQGVETVLNKAFRLAQDNEFVGDPSYITQTAKFTQAVTREDVMRVYNSYIKDKHYIMTSFVPKGQTDLIVDNAEQAEVWQEKVEIGKASEEVSAGDVADFEKTVTKADRSEPPFGPAPLFKMPEVWDHQFANGMKGLGIISSEIPLVTFDLVIKGGHWQDDLAKAGTADLMADMLMQGTAKKTAAELEEAIGLLGASINAFAADEEIRINASTLSRNFEETLALMFEILLEPRWDENEYNRLKQRLETQLKDRESNPSSIAGTVFDKLLYGKDHIMAYPQSGTLTTAQAISLDDLKRFYAEKLSPSLASFNIVGDIDKDRVVKAVSAYSDKWQSTDVTMASYAKPERQHEGKLFFIDVPGSKQSVIRVGQLALSGDDPDFNKLNVTNQVLGGGSSGRLFQLLRIEKGYTYGAYSTISDNQVISPFLAYTSVRANVTLESLKLIEDLIGNYKRDFNDKEMEISKNKVLKANTRAYEALSSKLFILRRINKYGLDKNYIEADQNEMMNMTLDDFHQMIDKYINEKSMFYLVVGDKKDQIKLINTLGKGKAVELDIYGNPR
ncbi:MAG: insulinase family protein [Calditrichaeota bacterium]|nr:insulinase family protein [Calditrichota bacterium]